MSGWDMSSGFDLSMALGMVEHIDGDPAVFTVLICAITVLVATYLTRNDTDTNHRGDFSFIGLGATALLILLLKRNQLSAAATREGLTVTTLFGYWGTLMSHLAIFGSGVFGYFKPPPQT